MPVRMIEPTPAPAPRVPREALFAALMALAFGAVVLWQVSVHELWRDEWNPWLIARHSASLLDLLANKRYEAHPALWYLLLYAVSRFAAAPLAMQLLHAAIAVLGAWTLLRFAPFTRGERALLIAGYFLLYEYAVIARNYAVAVLLLWAFCAAVARRPRSLLPALFLGLLAWSHALAAILAGLFALWWLGPGDAARRPSGWRRIAAIALLLAACAGAAWDAAPPSDGGVGRWHFGWDTDHVAGVLGALADALVPLTPLRPTYWNHHVLDPWPWTKAAVGVLLAALATFVCAERRRTLALWAASLLALLAFWYFRHGSAFRHFGFLFVALVAAAWLARSQLPAGPSRWAGARRITFRLLLLLQLPGAMFALAADAEYPFSACGAAAKEVQRLGLQDLPLVGETDVATAGVAGALDRPIYFVRGQRSTFFVLFDQERRQKPGDREIVWSARDLAAREGRDALLIMTRPLRQKGATVRRVATVPAGAVEDEGYILYRVSARPPLTRSARSRGRTAMSARLAR
jgi:hypothetical protein